MLCFYYKWRVSKVLDNDQELSPGLSRHLSGCPSCSEFYRAGQQLARQLTKERADLLKPVPGSLAATILSSIDHSHRQSIPPVKKGLRFMRPAAAAGGLALVTVVIFVWLVAPAKQPITPGLQVPLLASLDKSQKEMHKWVQQFESPIQKEARQLKESFKSATNFLKSCLDIKITKARIL